MDEDAVLNVGFSVEEGCSGAGNQDMPELVRNTFKLPLNC